MSADIVDLEPGSNYGNGGGLVFIVTRTSIRTDCNGAVTDVVGAYNSEQQARDVCRTRANIYAQTLYEATSNRVLAEETENGYVIQETGAVAFSRRVLSMTVFKVMPTKINDQPINTPIFTQGVNHA